MTRLCVNTAQACGWSPLLRDVSECVVAARPASARGTRGATRNNHREREPHTNTQTHTRKQPRSNDENKTRKRSTATKRVTDTKRSKKANVRRDGGKPHRPRTCVPTDQHTHSSHGRTDEQPAATELRQTWRGSSRTTFVRRRRRFHARCCDNFTRPTGNSKENDNNDRQPTPSTMNIEQHQAPPSSKHHQTELTNHTNEPNSNARRQ